MKKTRLLPFTGMTDQETSSPVARGWPLWNKASVRHLLRRCAAALYRRSLAIVFIIPDSQAWIMFSIGICWDAVWATQSRPTKTKCSCRLSLAKKRVRILICKPSFVWEPLYTFLPSIIMFNILAFSLSEFVVSGVVLLRLLNIFNRRWCKLLLIRLSRYSLVAPFQLAGLVTWAVKSVHLTARRRALWVQKKRQLEKN